MKWISKSSFFSNYNLKTRFNNKYTVYPNRSHHINWLYPKKKCDDISFMEAQQLLAKIHFHHKDISAEHQTNIKIDGNLLSFFCLDVAQGRTNWAPNENWTHSCRFASLPC